MFPRTLFGKLPTRHQQGDLCPVWSARAATKKLRLKSCSDDCLAMNMSFRRPSKRINSYQSFFKLWFFYMHQHIKTICLYLFHVLSELKELLPASPGQSGWAFGRCPSCHVEDWLPHGCEAQRGWPQRANIEFLWKGFDMIEDIIWVESMVIVDDIYIYTIYVWIILWCVYKFWYNGSDT